MYRIVPWHMVENSMEMLKWCFKPCAEANIYSNFIAVSVQVVFSDYQPCPLIDFDLCGSNKSRAGKGLYFSIEKKADTGQFTACAWLQKKKAFAKWLRKCTTG